jgi:hypothetical protein
MTLPVAVTRYRLAPDLCVFILGIAGLSPKWVCLIQYFLREVTGKPVLFLLTGANMEGNRTAFHADIPFEGASFLQVYYKLSGKIKC